MIIFLIVVHCNLDTSPYDNMNCSYSIKAPLYTLKTSSKYEYFYVFNCKRSYGDCIVVKFTSFTYGVIYAEASNEDINALIPIKYEKKNI